MEIRRKYIAQFLFPLLICAAPAFGGNEGAAGGDGVLVNDAVYALDLYESGLHITGFVSSAAGSHPRYGDVTAVVGRILQNVANDETVDYVARKMIDVYDQHPRFALALISVGELMDWRQVDLRLRDVNDENTILDPDSTEFVQLAVRKRQNVTIDSQYWQLTDPLNQAATIFHELVYAMVKPKMIFGPGGQIYRYVSTGDLARDIVASLFTQEMRQLKSLIATHIGFDSNPDYDEVLYRGLDLDSANAFIVYNVQIRSALLEEPLTRLFASVDEEDLCRYPPHGYRYTNHYIYTYDSVAYREWKNADGTSLYSFEISPSILSHEENMLWGQVLDDGQRLKKRCLKVTENYLSTFSSWEQSGHVFLDR